jgi:hypothetical protein
MDMSSIQYLATLAYKQKQSDEPWASLKKFDKEMLIKGIRSALDQGLLQLNEVRRKMEEKRLFVVKQSRENVSTSLEEWFGFLPPLKPIKLTHLINVTPEFKSSLLRDLKHGAANQRNKILVVESKIAQYSLAIQEKINEIVKKKVEASQVMSSCCEDINYMQDYSTAVKEYNDIVNNLNQILHDIRFSYVQSHLWNTHTSSALNFPSLNHLTFDEKTMYLGLINFCNLRNFCPIPDELLPICESKPTNIRIGNTIDDIIIKLKEDKRDMTQETFQRLLQLVGRNHMFQNHFSQENNKERDEEDEEDFDQEKNEKREGKRKGKGIGKGKEKEKEQDEEDFVESIKELDADVVTVLQKWFMERRHVNKKKDDEDEKSEVEKFFQNKNEQLQKEIIEFVERNKNCSLDISPLKKTLDNLTKLKELPYYIHRFSQVIPKVILHSVDNAKNEFFSHWSLNRTEQEILESSIFSTFSSYRRFYKQSEIEMVLMDYIDLTKPLCKLAALVQNNKVAVDNEEEKLILSYILLQLFITLKTWIQKEDHGCLTLSKKDNVKLSTENLREYNYKLCDLMAMFLQEIKQNTDFKNTSKHGERRKNEKRLKNRKWNQERTLEEMEAKIILNGIYEKIKI